MRSEANRFHQCLRVEEAGVIADKCEANSGIESPIATIGYRALLKIVDVVRGEYRRGACQPLARWESPAGLLF